ncbi:serine--tRNA ligase [Ichthyobacterium seriolicida]|uniref:Serine--tRNA ligase n=1 Tax=Ichthyobacterium seriolicida TaxID=242600 RepID=A0A1J1DXD7_9FLAO|nr:serine--tRNA ligase [Ichthyobacterium seriolicida]BAV94519.1 seryl-tRNA synthetase [Ichthyobacterium seriolicida]
MLNIKRIREEKLFIIEKLNRRNKDFTPLVEKVLHLDEKKRSLQKELDQILSESKNISEEIHKCFQSGDSQKAEALKTKSKTLKETLKASNTLFDKVDEELTQVLYEIPNITNDLVKTGKDESDNEIVFEYKRDYQDKEYSKPHWEIAENRGIISFKLGAKITGTGFPVYVGDGAKLQRALINYFLDKNIKAQYQEIQVPHLINESSGYGTGQLPDKENQMYHLAIDNLFLIPTSEVPVTNIYRDVLLKEEHLPIKHTSYTPCFRRESGSYGRDVKGLNRLHQFDKVEIVRIENPKDSYRALDEMVEHVKSILKELNLPFRILRLCTGDTGFTSSITYDFEVFSVVQKKWLEVSSVSNFETFQANRLKLRFKDKKGDIKLCHTLNGSSLALPRIVASLLEYYQAPDGIKIPEVLIPYMGVEKI